MSKINLFCLPFAGGSKYSYHRFVKHAPSHINVIPLELPGRGRRFKEKLLVNMDSMVQDILSQIQDVLDQPYAIYGHSMGTLLGYLLTKRILERRLPQPKHLFFTGRGGPSNKCRTSPFYLLPKVEFLKQLQELGGIPDDVLADKMMVDFFEPIIRADFHATETFQYQKSAPFDVPILIMIGINEQTTYDEALSWQEETVYPIIIRQFPGKHFFIFEYEAEILQLIAKCLTQWD